jgi:hypothetical protein
VQERSLSRALPALFSLAFGALTLWPFLTHHGVPAYQHDWSWSLEPVRFRDGLLQMLSTWNEEGFGHPNPFATANPIAILTVASGLLITPKIGLVILLALISLFAGLGVIALTRYATQSQGGAIVAALLYLTSPVFFNKTSAGQLAYLEAYALFPWMLYAAVRALSTGEYYWFAALAVLSGLESVQPQFFVYGPLAVLLFAVALWSRRGILAAVTAFGGAVLLNAPVVFAATSLQRGYALIVPHPVRQYEILHSAGALDALRMIGYLIPYAENAYARAPWGGAALLLLFCIPLFACAGILLSRHNRLVQGVTLLGAAGIVLSMGERGPLAPLFQWGFSHVTATTVFREFYHSTVLTTLAYAIATAYLIAAVPRLRFIVPALYLISLSPLFVSGHEADLHFLHPPAGQVAANSWIAGGPPGRVLALPYKVPLQVGNANVSGIDLFGYVDRRHMLAAEYGATPELDSAAALLADGHASAAASLLARYGVRYVVWRSWLRSAFPDSLMQPVQRPYAARAQKVFNGTAFRRLAKDVKCYAATCVGTIPNDEPLVEALVRTAAEPASWEGSRIGGPSFVSPSRPFTVRLPGWHLTPSAGWVDAGEWRWANPQWALLISPVAVTNYTGHERLRLATAVPVGLPYTGGPIQICARECKRLAKAGAPALAHLAMNTPTLLAEGPAAIGSPVGSMRPFTATKAQLTFTYSLPWRVIGTLRGAGPIGLVLRTRVDRGWVLRGLPVRGRMRVDGGLNGWIIDAGAAGGGFSIEYSPERTFLILAAMEGVFYCGLLASGIAALRARRRVS